MSFQEVLNECLPYIVPVVSSLASFAIVAIKTKQSTLIKKLEKVTQSNNIDWSKYELELEGKKYNLSQFTIKRKDV